jgi:LytS/YehU family sensor histidine kinase
LLASREENTSLSKELAITKHYLAMEELRFKDKLTYRIAVDAEVETALAEVPSLVFQPSWVGRSFFQSSLSPQLMICPS